VYIRNSCASNVEIEVFVDGGIEVRSTKEVD